MPSKLLPRKAEDVRPISRFAHASAEERERRAQWRAL